MCQNGSNRLVDFTVNRFDITEKKNRKITVRSQVVVRISIMYSALTSKSLIMNDYEVQVV